jgi:hypothetical protein
MTYLSIDASVNLSSTSDPSSAPNNTLQTLEVNPALSVQTGRAWQNVLAVGETATIMSTRRTLAYDATTQFTLSQPRAAETTTFRIQWTTTGTNPVFRTSRSIGLDATSKVRVTVLSTVMARIDTSSGTALSSTAVQIGDTLLIEETTDTFTSLFASANQGVAVTVQGKGTGYVDVVHNDTFTAEEVTLGANYANAIRIFSSGPVAVGDVIELGDSFNYGNRGIFPIVQVRNDYIEYSADSGVAETLIGVVSGDLVCYDKYINFLSLQATGSVIVSSDDDPVTIEPIDANGAMFLASLRSTKLEVTNNEDTANTVTALFSTISSSC